MITNKLEIILKVAFIIFLVILIFYYLLFDLTYGKKPSRNYEKQCFSNIRVLSGAVELYNFDHETNSKITTLSPDIENILVKEKYIKEILHCPDPNIKERYKSFGDISFDDGKEGFIYCIYHGDISGIIKNTNVDYISSTYSYSSNEIQELKKIINEHNQKLKRYSNRINFIDLIPYLFFIIPLIFTIKSLIKDLS